MPLSGGGFGVKGRRDEDQTFIIHLKKFCLQWQMRECLKLTLNFKHYLLIMGKEGGEKMRTIWTFSLAGIFFLFALCFNAYSIETKISDADATNIVLKNITKLDERGSYPRFSPDGKQILFTKKITKKQGNRQLEIPAIWIMDKDGKNMKVLLEDGYNGT